MGDGASYSILNGDCREMLKTFESESVQCVVTSPPYNLNKTYEQGESFQSCLSLQEDVLAECARVLSTCGSICWQVGHYVKDGAVVPWDAVLWPTIQELGLTLRNRVVWHFDHGLHSSHRFSGRYEVVLWLTKTDDYYFDLDAVRVPSKWPNKRHFKGPRIGQLSGNPLGKNPSDVWGITHVKNNHPEKTSHPCQFPEKLVERFILALSAPGDMILDPFAGSGTTSAVAVKHRRKSIGIELNSEYVQLIHKRLNAITTPLPLYTGEETACPA